MGQERVVAVSVSNGGHTQTIADTSKGEMYGLPDYVATKPVKYENVVSLVPRHGTNYRF